MVPAGWESVLRVAHDGWCPAPRGGPCACVPDLAVEVLPSTDWDAGPTDADLAALDGWDGGPDPRDEPGGGYR